MTPENNHQKPSPAEVDAMAANLIDLGLDSLVYARQISVATARSLDFAIPAAYGDELEIYVVFNADGTPLFAAQSGAALEMEVRNNALMLLPVH